MDALRPGLTFPSPFLCQVDALRAGMLGKDRAAFSYRYCNRRLIPVGRQGSNTMKYDNSGLSRAGELHAVLKEVCLPDSNYKITKLKTEKNWLKDA